MRFRWGLPVFLPFLIYRCRNFSDMADVSCNAHTKKKTGNTEAAVQPVFIVCAARAGYVCPADQQAGPLAASVGCKRKSCRQRIFWFHLHWSKRAAEKRRRNAGVLLEGCGEVAAVVEAETLRDLRDGQG